ncbi:MAG: cyclic nucleotide-binding domain-containing protein [Gammaproteobacteria bacterium]|nr:cyclic nucleotide-binding domain-containing protein [Gammaproteobacteria bacterium]
MNASNESLIETLSSEDLSLLESISITRGFVDQEIIFHQGEAAHCMYVVADGFVSISIDEQGVSHNLATLAKGSFVGEMALLGKTVRNATARAKGNVTLWEIGYEVFSALVTNDKLIADKLNEVHEARAAERIKIMLDSCLS